MATTEFYDGQDYDIGGEDRSSLLKWMGLVAGPASYATGGFDLSDVHADLDGMTLVHVQAGVESDHTLERSGTKILARVVSTGAEVAAAVDMSTDVIPATIYYRKP